MSSANSAPSWVFSFGPACSASSGCCGNAAPSACGNPSRRWPTCWGLRGSPSTTTSTGKPTDQGVQQNVDGTSAPTYGQRDATHEEFPVPLTLTAFSAADADDVRPALTACLAVPRWVDAILEHRPYADIDALKAAADLPLTTDEIRQAMAAHPRIGEKPRQKGTEGEWSRSEQSGVDNADALAAANGE